MSTQMAGELSAMSAFEPGDVIMTSEPWVYSLRQRYFQTHCYKCVRELTKTGVRKCSGCGLISYCSRSCLSSDFKKRHRTECPILKKISKKDDVAANGHFDLFLIFLKIVIKLLAKQNADLPGQCNPPTSRSFSSLISHEEELITDPDTLALCARLYAKWTLYFLAIDPHGEIVGDLKAFLSVYGKFRINSFSIMSPFKLGSPQKAIADGIYLGPSAIDHACDANAAQFFQGVTLRIKATKIIQKTDLIRISYVSTWDSICQRRRNLSRYFFVCRCPWCTDKSLIAQRHAIKCSTSTCNFPIPLDRRARKPCPLCHNTNNGNALINALTVTEKISHEYEKIRHNVEQLSQKAGSNLAQLTRLLEEGERILHPTNFLLGLLYCLTAPLALKLESKEAAYKLVVKAVAPMRVHLNNHDPAVLHYVGYLALWSLEFAPLVDVDIYAAELLQLLVMPHGEDSNEYRLVKKLLDSCELVTDLVS